MREIKYVEKEKISLMVKEAMNDRDRLIIKLFFTTFCRCNELRNIRVCDVKFGRGLINIRAENTKTKTPRVVVVPKKILLEVKKWLEKEGRDTSFKNQDFLFRSRQSPQLTNRRIRQVITGYAERLGINEVYAEGKDGRKLNTVTPHCLRHSGIIESLNLGLPQVVCMEQSGHKSLSAFQVYSRFSVKDRQRLFVEKRFSI